MAQTIAVWLDMWNTPSPVWVVSLGEEDNGESSTLSTHAEEADALASGRDEARQRGIALTTLSERGESTEVCSAEHASVEQHLLLLGDQWSGGPTEVAAVAQEWIDEGFNAESMEEWTEIGVWEPCIARALADSGIPARQIREAADERMRHLACRSGADADPIYRVCDGLADVDSLVQWARSI